MTFKHVKFEDSPTMRALEKVAKEKGLVKPETLQKKASAPKKLDISPSSNLMENIFKLCNGLREKGFEKEASELEVNYLNYKRAQTLYDTHNEKGEDLINAAHPEGSHKMEDIDSTEAVFENILEKHRKILEKVEKTPTGKLSNANSIIQEVKRALGQDAIGLAGIKSLSRKALAKVNSVVNEANPELTFSANSFASDFSEKVSNPTVYNLERAKETLKALKSRLDPSILSGGFGVTGISDYTWNRVQGRLNDANNLLNQAIQMRKELDAGRLEKEDSGEEEETVETKPSGGLRQGVTVVLNNEGKQFIYQANGLINEMSKWPAIIDGDAEAAPEEKNKAKAWIANNMIATLTKMRDDFLHIEDPNDQNNKAASYLSGLAAWKTKAGYDTIKSSWIPNA